MSSTFNAYHVWLGIPASEQPPNHYRLLGIAIFETDPDVIEHAADRQMAHVRTFQSGRHGPQSQQILNELAAARLCLLNAEQKSGYDAQLRVKLQGAKRGAGASGARGGRPVAKTAPSAPPVAQPVATARPVGMAAPAARPLDSMDVAMNLESLAGAGASGGRLAKLRRRRSGWASGNWTSPAIMGILAGIGVGVLVLALVLLKDVDWQQALETISAPPTLEERAPAPSAPGRPGAPAPASPSATS